MTFREMLDQIDAFLTEHADDGEGGKLWDVLTALRGADHNESEALKEFTTIQIRWAAFPRLSARVSDGGFHSGPSDRGPGVFRREIKFELPDAEFFSHFGQHASGAAVVLGLTTEGGRARQRERIYRRDERAL